MNQKVIFSIIFVILLLYSIALTVYAVANLVYQSKARADLDHVKKMKDRVVEELIKVQEEREQAMSENEKINADMIGFLAKQDEWQSEEQELRKELKKAEFTREDDLDRIEELEELLRKVSKEKAGLEKELVDAFGGESGLEGEVGVLRDQVEQLENQLKEERAIFYYNLGVAYDSGGMSEEALKGYKKSIEINPDNPDVYYNLGILYEEAFLDSLSAMKTYTKFLELRPSGEEAEQVKQWILAIEAQEAAAYSE